MKIRAGFVSNSSSSSFVIDKSVLSEVQCRLIEDHVKHEGEFNYYPDLRDQWDIYECDGEIRGTTTMDNFNMCTFLREVVKVDDKDVRWEH